MGGDIKQLKPNPNSRFKQGYFDGRNPRKYFGKRPIIYRSSLELNFMIKMELNPAVKRWGSESLVIKYQMQQKNSDGKIVTVTHNYNTDFMVELNSGNIYVVEVKPAAQVPLNEAQIKKTPINYKNACKWRAAMSYCKLKGWEFKIVTELHLKTKVF